MITPEQLWTIKDRMAWYFEHSCSSEISQKVHFDMKSLVDEVERLQACRECLSRALEFGCFHPTSLMEERAMRALGLK